MFNIIIFLTAGVVHDKLLYNKLQNKLGELYIDLL